MRSTGESLACHTRRRAASRASTSAGPLESHAPSAFYRPVSSSLVDVTPLVSWSSGT